MWRAALLGLTLTGCVMQRAQEAQEAQSKMVGSLRNKFSSAWAFLRVRQPRAKPKFGHMLLGTTTLPPLVPRTRRPISLFSLVHISRPETRFRAAPSLGLVSLS
jgi:hypothetical protein